MKNEIKLKLNLNCQCSFISFWGIFIQISYLFQLKTAYKTFACELKKQNFFQFSDNRSTLRVMLIKSDIFLLNMWLLMCSIAEWAMFCLSAHANPIVTVFFYFKLNWPVRKYVCRSIKSMYNSAYFISDFFFLLFLNVKMD